MKKERKTLIFQYGCGMFQNHNCFVPFTDFIIYLFLIECFKLIKFCLKGRPVLVWHVFITVTFLANSVQWQYLTTVEENIFNKIHFFILYKCIVWLLKETWTFMKDIDLFIVCLFSAPWLLLTLKPSALWTSYCPQLHRVALEHSKTRLHSWKMTIKAHPAVRIY